MGIAAIRVDGLGKRYRLAHGQERRGYRTLRESLVDIIKAPLRKRSTIEEFWALNNVSFQVQPGEVVGIIGRNGAGKSTLLKILSRITKPTTGRVEINGRVGSLLEVGTGFHPELTGMENIYLNGSILGMSRREIERKFDEIVAFAEVEKFLDTPVKRYSSGMYVRLAFAVAAHLEPEIMIVDEVLAVGDSSFQKKCLGKMGEVAQSGRTILFVSHSMQAIEQLTNVVIVMNRGSVDFYGPTKEGVSRYTESVFRQTTLGVPYDALPIPGRVHINSAHVRTSESFGEHICGRPISFEFVLYVGVQKESINFSFQVIDEFDRPVCHFWLLNHGSEFRRGIGHYRLCCEIPRFRLYQGKYTLRTFLTDRRGEESLEVLSDITPFEITMRGIEREEYDWRPGAMVYLEDCSWDRIVKSI